MKGLTLWDLRQEKKKTTKKSDLEQSQHLRPREATRVAGVGDVFENRNAGT